MSNDYQRADPAELRANVPEELKRLPAWLLWAESAPLKPGDKPRKVPHYVDGAPRGTTDTPKDRGRLVDFDAAIAAYERQSKPWVGPGVALGAYAEPALVLSGIDLDNCIDEGGLNERARSVVEAAHTYAEKSPSGRGVKLLGLGDVGTLKLKRDEAGLEIYSRGRFFTVTGRILLGEGLAPLAGAAKIAREIWAAANSDYARGPSVSEGGRNNALTSYLGGLRARGLTDDELVREALRFNEERCRPPLPAAEVMSVLRSACAWRRQYGLHDTGNAQRLLDWHGADLRYVRETREWISWSGAAWNRDSGQLRVIELAKDAANRGLAEVQDQPSPDAQKALARHLINSLNLGRLEAAVGAARSVPTVAISAAQLDAQRELVGTLDGGVLNLLTDQHRPATRSDLITRSLGCGFDPSAEAPLWSRFLAEQTSSPAMAKYLQQVVGVTLLGNLHRLVLFVYGPTGTGKTVFVEVIKALFGSYGRTASSDLLMAGGLRARNGPSEALARLAGARLVAVSETGAKDEFDEAAIKDLTGRDTVTARELYKGSFEFRPDFTIWIRGNHKPRFSGTDTAMLDRLRLVPFTVAVPPGRRDPRLQEKIIQQELPGVLNWVLAGVREVRDAATIETPPEVAQATGDYAREMDLIGSWLDEAGEFGDDKKCTTAEAYPRFQRWCKERGVHPWSATAWGRAMGERFARVKERGCATYLGVCVKDLL